MTTTTPTTPILLNTTSYAGFGVEWTVPGSGGTTTMQLANPRGTHYLLFSLRPHHDSDWLTMGVTNPKRFGLRTPATSFDEFLPVAQAFVAAIPNGPRTAPDHTAHPRTPCPRDPTHIHRRQHPVRPGTAQPHRMLGRVHPATKVVTEPGLPAVDTQDPYLRPRPYITATVE